MIGEWLKPRRHVYDPLAVKDGRRISTRDHIREIERQYPNKLTVKTHAFVTQVLFVSETPDGLYKVIGLNILKANTIGQIPEPLKPVTMQLLSIRFTSSEVSSGGTFNRHKLSHRLRRIKSVRHPGTE